jgi:hypothetical protein
VTIRIVTLGADGMPVRPVAIRYSWPSELDPMAGQAGLRLAERYADWNRRNGTRHRRRGRPGER